MYEKVYDNMFGRNEKWALKSGGMMAGRSCGEGDKEIRQALTQGLADLIDEIVGSAGSTI